MAPTRRELLAATTSCIVLAGCAGDGDETDTEDPGAGGDGGGDGSGDTEGDGDTDGGADMDGDGDTDGDGTAAVRVESLSGHGEVLVDADGMALYMFDSDEQDAGESACYDGCAGNWPPLTVEEDPTAGDAVGAELTTFEREDGSTQVAADGWPLYYFASDEEPGDVNGQGVGDVWWLLQADGGPIRGDSGGSADPDVRVESHSEHGDVLVDAEGMVLYNFDSDEQGAGESACYDGCVENWPPLTVEEGPVAADAVRAELTTFEREDGSMQVAANGWPLYYFASDEEPGDANGQGVGDVWWVLDPEGRPQRPGETDTENMY